MVEKTIDDMRRVALSDGRYPLEAYLFVAEALTFTIGFMAENEHRHISGQELLEGIRELASIQFGPLATTVFEQWNVRRTEDFGKIVFTMVDNDLLGKEDTDTISDFENGYSFNDTFTFEKVCERQSLQLPRTTYKWTTGHKECR